MSARKLSPTEARVLSDLVLCGEPELSFDSSPGDRRRALANLVEHGYITCRYRGADARYVAWPTRAGTYRILNPAKL